MKRGIWHLFAALCLAGAAAAGAQGPAEPGLSFEVGKTEASNVEGPEISRPFITAGKDRISFRLPQHGRLRGSADSLTLDVSRDGIEGRIQIRRSPLAPDATFSDGIERYHTAAEKELPQGLSEVEFHGAKADVYPFNGWKSLGFSWDGTLFGREMATTVSYINLEVGGQIQVTTVAERKSAPEVAAIARRFLSSWYVMSQ